MAPTNAGGHARTMRDGSNGDRLGFDSASPSVHPGGGPMAHDVAHVALHDDRESIVSDAVRTAKRVAGADSAMGAVRNEDASAFNMSELDGIVDPAFRGLPIRPGRGLGGQVASERQPRKTDDYLAETSITADYREVVQREGLRGIACVPVVGPAGTEVLLYVSSHGPGAPGGVAMEDLERVAEAAAIGLHHTAARARERELAVLRERQALATALHDSVAQSLFAIGIAAQRSREASDPSVLEEKLAQIEATAAAARSELRTALARLTRAPHGVGFEALFEAELRLFERRTGRRVWITRHGEPRDLGHLSEELLIDSIREGLTNAAKHAHGQVVLAHLAYQPTQVLLSLQTEQELPRRPASADRKRGSGLNILRKRTERLGGALELAFDDDGVAVLRIEIPA
jgi:signal transduction histidine kinase